MTDLKSSRATDRAFGVEDSTVEDDEGLKSCQFETLPPVMTEAKAVGATAVAVQEAGLASSANMRLWGYNSTVERVYLSVPAGLLTGTAVLSPVEKACCKNMEGEK